MNEFCHSNQVHNFVWRPICNMRERNKLCVLCLTAIFGMQSLNYTSHNLFGNFENTLFQRPVNISARPCSKSDRSSDITSLAFWFRNMFKDAPNTLFPLNKLSKWIRIWPTKNVTFISSMWMTSCKKERQKLISHVSKIWIDSKWNTNLWLFSDAYFCVYRTFDVFHCHSHISTAHDW